MKVWLILLYFLFLAMGFGLGQQHLIDAWARGDRVILQVRCGLVIKGALGTGLTDLTD